MLKKITLRNFKSFRDSTFVLGPLTLMVGANASGKSNFVDALRFLHGCARELTLSEILSGRWEGGQQVWSPIRGGMQEILNLFNKTESFELEVISELINDVSTSGGSYRIKIKLKDGLPNILEEQFKSDDEAYSDKRKELHPEEFLSEGQQIPWGYDQFTLSYIYAHPKMPEKVRNWALLFQKWLMGLYFLDIVPSSMREYVPKSRPEIGIRGENLSAMLFKLVPNSEQRRTVLGWIQELCPQEIVDFDFIETRLGDVLLAVKEPNGVTVSARSMSDGTLRFLAIIVAMLTAKEGTTFVIEEIDNDLHPSRLHLLVSFLEQVTMARRIQVIASTHSPYFLDHLSEESLKNVLVFHREVQAAETKVTRLVVIPGFAEARKNMSLDLMHASSWMEQNL
jgi:predicted ATPase